MKQDLALLLNLVAAIGGCQVDNQAQFSRCMIDVLPLEGSFFGFIRPRQTFVQIKSAVNDSGGENQPPSDCFKELQRRKMLLGLFLSSPESFKEPYESSN